MSLLLQPALQLLAHFLATQIATRARQNREDFDQPDQGSAQLEKEKAFSPRRD